jgi:ornithine carbamoyltransferase
MNHLVTLRDCPPSWIAAVLEQAARLKAHPERYATKLERKELLMIFEKPSLRTRVSFETGMSQLGGHAIHYDTSTSPFGAGKESVHDMIKVASRYVDIVMARLFEHAHMEEMAAYADVPVINALTNFVHPCQILADLLTIQEKKGRIKGVRVAYVGDANNNVTHSLMFGCAKAGAHLAIGCPPDDTFLPQQEVLDEARAMAAPDTEITVTANATEAARDADVIYTDSWMSYHIPKEELDGRVTALTPYQVNLSLMKQARPDAIFMNCLPAARGYEQTAEVIDGPQSVVFDQAENRLHAQKSIMIQLLKDTGALDA